MSKKLLVDSLSEKTGLTKTDVTKIVDALPEVLQAQLDEGGRAVLHNVAIFTKKHVPARVGRNPASGEAMDIKAKDVIKIKPAGVMKTTS